MIDSPRILTGYFNKPEWYPNLEKIVVWGEGKGAPERCPDQFGDERPSIEWANGVRSVLDGEASQHRLRDSYQVRRGPEEPPCHALHEEGQQAEMFRPYLRLEAFQGSRMRLPP